MIRLLALFFVIVYIIYPSPVFASSLILSSQQTNLSSSDEFIVNAGFNISTSDGTSYYLRGVFFKEGTSNYCGYTWNGNSWYNGPYSGGGFGQLLPITVYQGSWSGQLKAKIDSADAGCQSSGTYNFKIQRYTGGGSSSFDDQNNLTVAISLPTPTPTPTPTLTPTPTPTRTPTLVPTSTPTAIQLQKITPTQTKQSSNTAQTKTVATGIKENSKSSVLGSSVHKDNNSPVERTLIKGESTDFMFPPVFYVIFGLSILVIACGILLFREWKKQKNEEL
ncbi:MAG TPA: hypothetical protein PKA38_02000 [Candidatus Levybacteria bacterium]|nr:hypothetical protein [Candidatus Levybacteria bacterium]